MTDVTIETVKPRLIAAVRRQVRIGEVGSAWGPALDKVWAFLQQHPGLRTDGHNVFLYHHPANRQSPMNVDFGVEVIREFEPAGEVTFTRTPAGRVASAIHRGPYARMKETHDAIHAWAVANKETFAGQSWEIYGDPQPEESKTEVLIQYLLV
jgi:effector-binding domain-containing protein